ncbi:MAG: ATP-binding cassette domain-containing protein, partial [Crocinitomicaceae bacterium]|nr:ATP-binding cassette domain-containing protein [Crocinitomicaceae bacterium]
MGNILQVNNLSVAYGSKRVVKDCTFAIEEGEIAVLLGASGDGKTTLLNAIAGLLPHKKGEVIFDGERVIDASEKLVPGHHEIRLVDQNFGLDVHHTVEENIRLKLLRFDKEYQTERIRKLLRLTRLTTFKLHKATHISGGQQQRLAIARALADEPELLLLDEPFNQLDFQTKTKIAGHIRRYLKKNRISAIMVTHNGVEAMEWADKIIYMEKGRIKRVDEPQNFFEFPRSKKEASFFGELNKLKIKGKEIFFRPSFFSSEKTETFKRLLDVEFLTRQNLGWYSIFTFTYEGQEFRLFSTDDISNLTRIY